MTALATIFVTFVGALLDIEMLLLLVRAVMSWVMPDPSSRLWQVVYGLTEPVIWPFRRLLSRFAFVQMCPIDLAYLAVFLFLRIIRSMLH